MERAADGEEDRDDEELAALLLFIERHAKSSRSQITVKRTLLSPKFFFTVLYS